MLFTIFKDKLKYRIELNALAAPVFNIYVCTLSIHQNIDRIGYFSDISLGCVYFIFSDNSRYSTDSDGLVIHNVTKQDSGTYICRARSDKLTYRTQKTLHPFCLECLTRVRWRKNLFNFRSEIMRK